jgi:hypothetical protein
LFSRVFYEAARDLDSQPPLRNDHVEACRPQGFVVRRAFYRHGIAGLDHAFLAWGTHARRPARAIAELGEAVRTMLAAGA